MKPYARRKIVTYHRSWPPEFFASLWIECGSATRDPRPGIRRVPHTLWTDRGGPMKRDGVKNLVVSPISTKKKKNKKKVLKNAERNRAGHGRNCCRSHAQRGAKERSQIFQAVLTTDIAKLNQAFDSTH